MKGRTEEEEEEKIGGKREGDVRVGMDRHDSRDKR
jgi:hypothetical protein